MLQSAVLRGHLIGLLTVVPAAAWAGTLEVGKRADLLVLEGEAFRQVPYRPGHNPVLHAYAGGTRVGGR